jgi:hypothetical protein
MLSSTMNTFFSYHSSFVSSPKLRPTWTCWAALWTLSSPITQALSPRPNWDRSGHAEQHYEQLFVPLTLKPNFLAHSEPRPGPAEQHYEQHFVRGATCSAPHATGRCASRGVLLNWIWRPAPVSRRKVLLFVCPRHQNTAGGRGADHIVRPMWVTVAHKSKNWHSLIIRTQQFMYQKDSAVCKKRIILETIITNYKYVVCLMGLLYRVGATTCLVFLYWKAEITYKWMTQTRIRTTQYSKHCKKLTPDSSTQHPYTRGTGVTNIFQHNKTKMAGQQDSTLTTQQEHTGQPHAKPWVTSYMH